MFDALEYKLRCILFYIIVFVLFLKYIYRQIIKKKIDFNLVLSYHLPINYVIIEDIIIECF